MASDGTAADASQGPRRLIGEIKIIAVLRLEATTHFYSSVFFISAGHSTPPILRLIRYPSCKFFPATLAYKKTLLSGAKDRSCEDAALRLSKMGV